MHWMDPVPHCTGSISWWVQKEFRPQNFTLGLPGRQKKNMSDYQNEDVLWRNHPHWWSSVIGFERSFQYAPVLFYVCASVLVFFLWHLSLMNVVIFFFVYLLSFKVCGRLHFSKEMSTINGEQNLLHTLVVGQPGDVFSPVNKVKLEKRYVSYLYCILIYVGCWH